MKKFTLLVLFVLATATCLMSQPLVPTAHGLDYNQPAWSSQNNQVQEFSLVQGFAWWSTYIELGANGLTTLENALGDDASLIKSSESFVSYQPESGTWTGVLSTINNSGMYLLLINNATSTFQLEGTALNPADVAITVAPGWNWVGYPSSTSTDINAALANYNAHDNDMFKSQNGFASYSGAQGGWIGSLSTLNPGEGYILLSNGSSQTFHYATASKDAPVEQQAQNTIWKVNPKEFAQNMTVIATVNLHNIPVRSDDFELGVFHGDLCRGTTQLQYVEATDSYMAFLTSYGYEGEELQFRLLDHNTGEVYAANAQQNITYSDNAMIGLLSTPYQVEFKNLLNCEEALAGMLSIYPNPMNSNQTLTVNLPEGLTNNGKVQVQVINLLGQLVSEETMTGNALTISGLTSGLYTLRVITDGAVVSNNKLIVK